jgi:DNA-directed RNA polymerase subunit L
MENVKITQNGFRLDAEIKNVPVAVVNALRRILLAEIPTVVVRDVQILDNNTHLVHEMLRHRVEMLPINVKDTETDVIRDTKIELRMMVSDKERTVTTDDFAISGPRREIFLKDRDLGTHLLFMYLKPGESVHIKASLGLQTHHISQVCVSTYKFHIDPVLAQRDKDTWVAENNDPAVFDNFQIQRSYAMDPDTRRPNHFDFSVESIGVVPAKDLLRDAVKILQTKAEEWSKTEIVREGNGWFRVETDTEGHTIGNLAQQVMYGGGLVEYVSYRIPHPLLPTMVVRFHAKTVEPDAVMTRFRGEVDSLCKRILESL